MNKIIRFLLVLVFALAVSAGVGYLFTSLTQTPAQVAFNYGVPSRLVSDELEVEGTSPLARSLTGFNKAFVTESLSENAIGQGVTDVVVNFEILK